MKHHVHILRATFITLALCIGFATVGFAQEITGSIAGTVRDANGAAVSGATVTITDLDKKVVVRTVTTNDDGQFSAPDLVPGNYDVSIEAPNFKKYVESKLGLTL